MGITECQQQRCRHTYAIWWILIPLLSQIQFFHPVTGACTYVRNIRRELGRSAYLTCKINNDPSSTTLYSKKWIFKNSPLYTIYLSPNYNRDEAEANYRGRVEKIDNDKIKLLRLSQADSGTYTCSWDVRPEVPGCVVDRSAYFTVTVIIPVSNVRITVSTPVVERTTATFTCSADGTKPISYTIEKTDGSLASSDRWDHNGNGQFTLGNVQRGDAGQYRCRAVNELNRTESSSVVHLDVLYPPSTVELRTSPSNMTVMENTYVTLTCTAAEGNPTPNVTLSKDRISVKTGKQSVAYSFNVQRDDNQKKYQCRAQGAGSPVDADREVTFNVLYPPDKVTLQSSPSSLTLKEKTEVTLTCNAEGGNPPPDVSIYQSGEVLKTNKQSVELKFKVEKYDNQKAFKCRASGAGSVILEADEEIEYNVQYPPEKVEMTSSLQGTTHKEGTAMTLTCTATGGNPPPDVTIEHSDRVIERGDAVQTLHHQVSLQRGDNQVPYVCKAYKTGIYGVVQNEINFNVLYPPEVTMTISTNPVIEGHSITLTCSSKNGNPDNVVKWSFRRTSGLDSSKLFSNENILTIMSAAPNDTGPYTCRAITSTAWNIYAEVTKNLTVYYKARLNKDRSTLRQGADFGETAKLVIYVNATPKPSFDWYRKTATGQLEVLRQGTDVLTDCRHSQLIIKDIRRSDFGSYICRVVNRAGSKDFLVRLIPAGPPVTPVNLKVASVGLDLVQLEWLSQFNGGYKQTFSLMYRKTGSDWPTGPQIMNITDPGENETVSYNVKGLESGTSYEFRLIAVNKRASKTNKSKYTTVLSAATEKETTPGFLVITIVCVAVIIIIAGTIGAVVLYKRRHRTYQDTKNKPRRLIEAVAEKQRNEKNLKMNLQAEPAGIAETIPLTAVDDTYGNMDQRHNNVDRQQNGGQGGDDTYENFQVKKPQPEEAYQNLEELRKQKTKAPYVPAKIIGEDGVVYEDPSNFDFQPSKNKPKKKVDKPKVVEDEVVYADIDHTKKA